MSEIPELRTRESKTYDLGRGNYRLVCGGDISHFLDSDGSWQETDFTYNDIAPAGWTHYYSKNEWRVLIDRPKGRIVILPDRSDDTKYILFRAHPTANVAINVEELDRQTLHCWRVGPNEAYHFLISPKGIKPYVYLYNETAVKSWTLGFSLNNLTRVGRKVYDGERLLGVLPNPFFVDAEGNIGHVNESIDGDTATINWDATGFKFPVIVDPTVSFQPSTMDSYMIAGDPDTPFGLQTSIQLQKFTAPFRQILAFDVSSIPTPASIRSAVLDLVCFQNPDTDASGLSVSTHPLSRTNWVEAEATWNSYSTGNAWTTPGGDFVSSVSDADNLPSLASLPITCSFNILNTANYCNSTQGGMWHFHQKFTDDSGATKYKAVFASNQNATVGNRPKLTIYYELFNSIYKTYKSVALIGRMRL